MLYKKIIEQGKVTFTDTSSMSRTEWLELRRTGIGGSDGGAIMGLNKYASPLSVYLSKKGITEETALNEAIEWGNILEEPIRKKAGEELGIQIESVPCMFRSKSNPFMTANLDGLLYFEEETEISGTVLKGLCGHEIKTSREGEGFTKDEIPDSYYAQVQHYMAVTGLTAFVLTVFVFNKYAGKHYAILRNEDFINHLICAEKNFWENNVQKDEMPAPFGDDKELSLLKSLPAPENIILPDDCEPLMESRANITEQIKELEKKKKLIESEILIKINEHTPKEQKNKNAAKTVAVSKDWQVSVTLQTKMSVNTDALKKAGIYEDYAKPVEVRVMRITKRKGA